MKFKAKVTKANFISVKLTSNTLISYKTVHVIVTSKANPFRNVRRDKTIIIDGSQYFSQINEQIKLIKNKTL